MQLFIRWLCYALALIFTSWVVPGIEVSSFLNAMFVVVIIALINTFVKPVLQIITLPVNILTLGLFTLVINALLFMLAGYFAPGVTIEGFLHALLGSLLLAFLGGIIFNIPDKN